MTSSGTKSAKASADDANSTIGRQWRAFNLDLLGLVRHWLPHAGATGVRRSCVVFPGR
jgi:hypothetical protein